MFKTLLTIATFLVSASAIANVPCALTQGENGSVEIVLTKRALVQIDSCKLNKETNQYQCQNGGELSVQGKDIPSQFAAMPNIVGVGIYRNGIPGRAGSFAEICLASTGSFEK